jgi:glycosyltransferase involved in cell wall biosynthesis
VIRLAFLLPHLRPGGAERVVVNYLRALDRDRFEPVLILGRCEGAFLDLLPNDVPVLDLGGARARRLPRRIARLIEQHRIDLAYSATDAMNLALLASRWWGGRRARRIVSMHTTPAARLAEASHPRLRRWWMRRLYPKANLVAVPAAPIASELKALLGRDLRTAVLPNPVVEHVEPRSPRAHPRPRIVSIGRLVEAKGHDLLIDAAALLTKRGLDFELAIHGEGPMRPELESRIESSALGDRVTLAGHADSRAVLAEADLLVLPSRREGFGNVLVEAMAAGVPVLAASCAGPASLIEDGINGFLVEAGCAAALADGLAALLADRPRQAVIEAGLATVARFRVDAATHRFEAEVLALLGKDRHPDHPDPGQAKR